MLLFCLYLYKYNDDDDDDEDAERWVDEWVGGCQVEVAVKLGSMTIESNVRSSGGMDYSIEMDARGFIFTRCCQNEEESLQEGSNGNAQAVD